MSELLSDIVNAPGFERTFLPKGLAIKTWDDAKPFADDLSKREWKDAADYQKWLKDWSEFEIVMDEAGGRLYIDKSCDTENEELEKAYIDWEEKVATAHAVFQNDVNNRMAKSPFNDDIKDSGFKLLLKRTQSEIDLFREENVALDALDAKQASEYGNITGSQTIFLDGKEVKVSGTAPYLQRQDRGLREKVWFQGAERRLQDKNALDDLYGRMVANRHQIALNAGEKNYRDYKFKELKRFTYTADDCKNFHMAMQTGIVPLVKEMLQKRRSDMGLETVRPWDLTCHPKGLPPLVAFKESKEMIDKTIVMLDNTVPMAADTLRRMQRLGTLDLDERKGKRNGGYNCGLPETRTSFMFTNQTGMMQDMKTCVHETGHAFHNMMMFNQPLFGYTKVPMEIAELASMSLELMTHDEWHQFFPDEQTCSRAKYEHLAHIVDLLPRIAQVDAFQHEIYENPDMNVEERHDAWEKTATRFGTGVVDYSGLNPEYKRTSWQGILHIYEVPFYVIEYGFAQLGALQMWKNYRENKEVGVKNYQNALSLGYTKSVPETYAAGGVKFDFSNDMINDLMGFVGEEMQTLAKKMDAPKTV